MSSNTLALSVSLSDNAPILLGGTFSFKVNVKNLSTTNKLYNLNLSITLPDGLLLSTSTLPQTTTVTNADNSTTYSWINIKDLAAMEIDYLFSITIKSSTTFKNGSLVPFNYSFSGINLKASMDTMPRGSYDSGNKVFSIIKLLSFLTVAYYGTVSTPGKILKGAGTSITLNDASQIYTATIQITNNYYSASTVAISILLDDGIRYLANLLASGTDASKFGTPIINRVLIGGKYYTELLFSSITLSKASITIIKFSFAVWNRYENNAGSLITHGSSLGMTVRMGASASSYSISTSFSFAAMDLIVSCSVSKTIIDIGYSLVYSFYFLIGQYYILSMLRARFFLPDGLQYISSSYAPFSIEDNMETKGCLLTYDFGTKGLNTSTTVTINALVNATYRYRYDSLQALLPVVAYDAFTSSIQLTGLENELSANISDNAEASCRIQIGTIKKQYVNGYYRDGSLKTIAALAPNDSAEFTLTYDASFLNAIQKQIFLDDFFPLAAGPVDTLTYHFSDTAPISSPSLISPHGVDFYYGDIAKLQKATINFKVPINALGGPGQNNNLMKLTGTNTDGYSYSARDQITVAIGSPNLKLTKTVTGPSKSAIQSSQAYIYTVVLSNTNTLGTETDAFSFTLTDTITNWGTLYPDTISVTGTGLYSSFDYTSNKINVYIDQLAPGASLTLSYSVTLKDTLAPGLTLSPAATNTNPYSQPYDASLDNYQYTGLIKTATSSLTSKPVVLTKANNTGTFKVSSSILYTLTATIPVGTIVYNSVLKDTLPVGQSYVGPCYRNGALIVPAVSGQVVAFPAEPQTDARSESKTITYMFYASVMDANKSFPNYVTTQTNSCQYSYHQTSATGTTATITKTLGVAINHPNLILTLGATDLETSSFSYSGLSIAENTSILFSLSMENNSMISLVNGLLELPIDPLYDFVLLGIQSRCTAAYDETIKKLIINIPSLASNEFGQLTFTLRPKKGLASGSSMTTTASCVSYYNDITASKVYGGETSNTITNRMQVGLSLLPDPATKINDSTSFIVTSPGEEAVIHNYFKNTGGGTDSFRLAIAAVPISYTLSIDGIKVADVAKNMAYSADLNSMRNLPAGAERQLTITTMIPADSSLGFRYDFMVSASSLTSPYPSKTVLNIDPS